MILSMDPIVSNLNDLIRTTVYIASDFWSIYTTKHLGQSLF